MVDAEAMLKLPGIPHLPFHHDHTRSRVSRTKSLNGDDVLGGCVVCHQAVSTQHILSDAYSSGRSLEHLEIEAHVHELPQLVDKGASHCGIGLVVGSSPMVSCPRDMLPLEKGQVQPLHNRPSLKFGSS